MESDKQKINCPIHGLLDFQPCDPTEVTPLIEFLVNGEVADAPREFPRGTMMPDGRLDLCKQSLGPGGCSRVAGAVKLNPYVRSLLLGTDGIGDVGAASVAEMVRENQTLEIVYLGCNNITGVGAAALAEALKENDSVKGLWLKRNPIGDEGALAIAELIQTNSNIEVLDLVNTGIGKHGLAAILGSLEGPNCSVRRLYLGGNGFDSEDAELISKSLKNSATIESLMLSVNFLGDAGAGHIAQLVQHSRNLRELGLGSNGISAAGIEGLCAVIANHPNLGFFDLGTAPSTKVLGAKPNDVAADGIRHLIELVGNNARLQKINLRGFRLQPEQWNGLEDALKANQNLSSFVVDGPQPETVRELLGQNAKPDSYQTPNEIRLIRSVYR